MSYSFNFAPSASAMARANRSPPTPLSRLESPGIAEAIRSYAHAVQLSDSLPPAYTPHDSSSQNSHAPTHDVAAAPLPFRASDFANESKTHLLLCASGSVATIKLPLICGALSVHASQLSIRLVLTPSATSFLAGQSPEQPAVAELAQIPGVDGIYTDADEWAHPWSRSGPGGSVPILHIELRRWADILVIAPLSANTLAKIVGGLADGLLTSVVRAWDTDGSVDGVRPAFLAKGGEEGVKRIWMAPAMNTAMWRQPITRKQIGLLEEEFKWVEVLKPVAKELACGDVGDGAMVDWRELVAVLVMWCRLHVGGGQGVEAQSVA